MLRLFWYSGLVGAAFLAASPRIVAGQTQSPACTYDRCALRIDNSVPHFPTRVVQGVEARPVATLGLFATDIPLLATARDSVRIPYEAYRHRKTTGDVFQGLALGALLTIPFTMHQNHGSAALPLMGAATVLGITGVVESARAGSQLQMAIDRYNDSLPDRR